MQALIFISFIVFVASIVLLIKGAIKKNKSKQKRNLIILAVSFVLMIVGGANSPQPQQTKSSTQALKQAPKPKDLSTLVSENFDSGKVIPNNDQLVIQFKGTDLSENFLVTGGLNSIKIGLNKIYRLDEFKKYKTVQFNVMGTFTDKYGNNSQDVAMSVMFDQSELQKVNNFSNLTDAQLIQLQGTYRTGVSAAIRKGLKPEILSELYPND